jgi:Protein of unknown function (DUF3568)
MRIRHLAVTLMLLSGVVASGGCALFLLGAGAAAGAGTVAYMGGVLKASDEVSMDRAWNASLQAMKDLEFKVTKSQKDALEGEITAHRADDTKITILLKKQTDKVTEFRIRVGFWGDENLSRLIYDKIKSHY